MEKTFTLIQLMIAILTSVGGFNLIKYLIDNRKRKVKNVGDFMDTYQKQMKTFIETHSDSVARLTESLDTIQQLELNLKRKQIEVEGLTTQTKILLEKLESKNQYLFTLKQEVRELKEQIENLKCERGDCPQRIKNNK